ncbi:protein CASC3-like isoform X2 [Hyposmocoma kahamanoa]|uniref:protein CASC3-like isoform X2 n=1 Tax=Hyposmocoma kahamanoa TaxID=1477025 RepID=UPI000E6D5F7A|nr:protein CASC3-like isoform X2 [Hyposmocoma kahamanoa]
MTSVSRRQERQDPDSEYSDASHAENDHDNSGNDAGQAESDYDSAGSESDRSDRDPDNQETERRVDDDEDRSNPQYIPKRGTFYEHDDRTAASGEDSIVSTSETASEKKEIESPADRRRGPRKSESVNKWSHDKYNENEQVPKSRDELVAIYGYDIRNEDAPPHARRNRRYGRGPNKYTRTWEDVDAYRRQANAPTPNRKPPNPEDFPELEASNRSSKKRAPRPRSKSQPSSIDSSDQGSQLRRNASVKATKNKQPPPRQNIGNKNAPRRDQRRDVKKDVKEKMPPIENLTITSSTLNNSASQPQRKVNAAVAQQRPVPTEQGKKKPPPPQAQQPQQQNNAAPNKSPPLEQAPQTQQQKPPPQNQPPGEQRGGSKRYSSLRQRPLDTYSPQQQQQPPPQQPQQQHRYHSEYTGGAPAQHQGSPAPQMHPQQMMQQSHRSAPVIAQQHGPSPPHQQLPPQQLQQQQLPQPQLPQQQLPQQQLPQQQLQQQQLPQQHSQQVRLGMMEQQPLVPHSHHSIHNMPQPHTMVSGQLPPGQPYAPPAMMPAQYMQQGGSGAVFGGAAMYAQPPAPYPHQLYQHHNYATQAGGVTYYSCAEQDVAVAAPTTAPRQPRRPTAAIPIVRPHHAHLPQDRPANSSEKDNIDRIVENMFVRKPWPATHGADASKEKSETRNSQEPQSKESSQPNSLTSSSISTDSKPSEIEKESKEESKEQKENSVEKELKEKEFKEKELKEVELKEKELNERELNEKESKENEQSVEQESISTDA